jgi:hypothetical protein
MWSGQRSRLGRSPRSTTSRLACHAVSTDRLNRVVVAGSRESTTVEIPWDSRQALLERLRREGEADNIIAAFRAVGTTSPVKLKPDAKRRLLATCEVWLMEATTHGLPPGIFELRNALQDEDACGALD